MDNIKDQLKETLEKLCLSEEMQLDISDCISFFATRDDCEEVSIDISADGEIVVRIECSDISFSGADLDEFKRLSRTPNRIIIENVQDNLNVSISLVFYTNDKRRANE